MGAVGAAAAAAGLVVIDFWSRGCAPCVAFAPAFARLASALTPLGVAFCSVDVDESPDLADDFAIAALPTLKLLNRSGCEVATVEGADEVGGWVSE